ncbi:23 kDa integral membrane protein [Drosophila subpulchrella]|uniref:23 kDa integral membrane protein n=1 Tax=Drosophila subpulchrella TaxID=1486046 RepID=UPI0018A16C39|nr:23 kDa integral membrane protein [Drosophila subpulchrella]XP_037714530.1 23 kDa integral membrane protein [Drosophila subpulchrella]
MASTSSVKLIVYALDVLCTLLALVLISFGIYVVVSYDLDDIGKVSAYAYVGLGIAALVVVLWGYLSAWRENVCCTVTFIVFLCLVIIAQFAVVYVLITQEKSVASNLANALEATWEEELNSPGAMSLYQNWFQCCGRGSPQDYIVNERLPPDTCFRNHDKSKPENLIHTGCRVEFENYWLRLTHIFNILALVLIAIELLLSVISCRLCNSIRNDARRSYF